MLAVVQRVKHASVQVEGLVQGQIEQGLMVLLGISEQDSERDALYMATKIPALRIFADEQGKMNRSVQDTGGNILLISQFTLIADTAKGHRPSFMGAAKPDKAIPLYEKVIEQISQKMGFDIQTGVFGADMQVSLQNDGPVTIILNSHG
ncbi:MAG: D-tyrosyl-tRNA(Tyr) deacylase [Cytophagales bacterium]|nr:MAG: D-tyrosyl-tRNA(Tyr) deacylase [Cytophagales bacterium]TAF60993.1 MAG: D-tyrosyl-tRNA(Tyr) deacylase [Cytophagales bacterium]